MLSDLVAKAARTSVLWVVALATAAALGSCAEVDNEGKLCDGCTEDNPCESAATEFESDPRPGTPEADFYFRMCGEAQGAACPFCAATSEGTLCAYSLICTHQTGRAARRCYPKGEENKALATFECEGLLPDPAG